MAPLYVFVLVSHLLFCALRNIFYEILISPKHLNIAELNSNLINFRLLSNKIIVVFVWNKVKRSPFLFNLKERKLSNKKIYWSKKIYNLFKCNRKYHFISISTSHYITPGPYYVHQLESLNLKTIRNTVCVQFLVVLRAPLST